jgi:hypothetical protein
MHISTEIEMILLLVLCCPSKLHLSKSINKHDERHWEKNDQKPIVIHTTS